MGNLNDSKPSAPNYVDHLLHLATIQHAALSAADPRRAVLANLHLEGSALRSGPHTFDLGAFKRIYLIGVGKASPAMCEAVAEVLGDRLTSGIAAIPIGHTDPLPEPIRGFPAGHPLPNEGSIAAGQAIADLLTSSTTDDLVVAVISGGGSAMLELPIAGITLEHLRLLNKLLLHSGAPIEEVNTIRKSLSQIKAGGLARMAAPAPVLALILSDVVGDHLSSIASGPTVVWRRPTKTSRSPFLPYQAARATLESYQLWEQIPEPIRDALDHPPDLVQRARRPRNVLVGSNRFVLKAAYSCANKLGFPSRILTHRMRGEASTVGRKIGTRLLKTYGPACILMGGETTVTIRGEGLGGRNLELALAAALAVEGAPKVALMTLATDGVDGPTDAAGAMISGETITKARAMDLKPEIALKENNSYPLLDALGSLIRTGPTGTNLNDLVVGLVYRK